MVLDTASPNVTSRESTYSILTQGDSSVSTGLVCDLQFGPCFINTQVTSEDDLINMFGNPTDTNYEHWFSAYSYLAYSNNLQIVRAVKKSTAKNAGFIAVDIDDAGGDPESLTNPTVYNDEQDDPTITFTVNQKAALFAKYPGTFGNNIKIAIANNVDFASAEISDGVTFANNFDYAPSDNEFAIAIYVNDVLTEKFICSVSQTGKDDSGNINYFVSLLNNSSGYIRAVDNTGINKNLHSFELTSFSGGVGDTPETTDITAAYEVFDDENIDVNIILDGANTSTTVQQYIIDNITSVRQDCVAYIGPQKSDVVNVANISTAISNLTDYVSTDIARSSSYAAFFGNWKLMYDHINGKDRWVPITADMAGIYARAVVEKEPWYSGFGPTLGKIKNIKRLAISPKKSYRDTLYKGRVNPIYNDKEDGPIMFGQKTLLSANTPFNRIDTRFLFIYLREAIDRTARQWVGEKNTAFQRRRFVNSITPFLESVQGREGIDSFYVQCDETNNTSQIIEQNGFVCNVLGRPTYTIEFISITYSSVSGSVTFEEAIVQNVATQTP